MNAAGAVDDVASTLEAVRERIRHAARSSGREPSTVRLVAVSKTKTRDAIRSAYAAGQRDFGENYAQELARKADELADLPDLRWHFIGHLQRNKAKLIARVASAVHTVDSVRLAEELGKRAAETPVPSARAFTIAGIADSRLPVFVEVNIAAEDQKSGASPADLGRILDAVYAEPSLRAVGLMTVPPASPEPHGARRFFDALVELRSSHGGVARLPELSMGMSHDLEDAVAAGATVVRVGTAIFGART